MPRTRNRSLLSTACILVVALVLSSVTIAPAVMDQYWHAARQFPDYTGYWPPAPADFVPVEPTGRLNDVDMVDGLTGFAVGYLTGTSPATPDIPNPSAMIALCSSGSWSDIYLTSHNTELLGVAAPDATHVWAVGDGGLILQRGATDNDWVERTSGTTSALRAVAFGSTSVGWAVGDGGTVLQTGNGTNWSVPTVDPGVGTLYDVFALDATHAWAVGADGVALYRDAGGAWRKGTGTGTAHLRSVYFTNASNGWAVGDGRTALRTVDGGLTWTAQTLPASPRSGGEADSPKSVVFYDSARGMAVGDHESWWRTENGGATWLAYAQVGSSPSSPAYNLVAAANAPTDVSYPNDIVILSIPDRTLNPLSPPPDKSLIFRASLTWSAPDTTNPSVSITAPTNGATVSGSVALAATASDNVGVTRVEFRVDGNLVGTDTSAPYTGTWNATGASVGAHSIEAKAFDGANNTGTHTISVNVPDATNPSVSITAPTNGGTVSGSVPLAASASDNVGVTKVEFRVDGNLVGTDTSAPYTGTWNATGASAGAHSIEAKAFDGANNTGTHTISVNVPDTTNPSVSITAPTNGATVSGSVPLAASASDNVGVTKVEFRVDGNLVGTDTSAPYTGTWNASGAAVGSHSIEARAYDAAGLTGSHSISVNIPDTTNPSVSITAPTNGATVSGSVPLAASASDNVGVSRVEFRVDGVLVATDTSAPYTGTWNSSTAAPGGHAIVATAYDAAGNSAEASIIVNIAGPADTTDPTVSITSPTNGATVSGWVPVGATASDNVGVVKVEFRIDGVLVATDLTQPYGFNWDSSSAAPGSHSIEARAYDAADLTGSHTISVTIAAPTSPVYRFYNKRTGTHFYTIDAAEAARVASTLAWLYNSEGPAYNAYPTQQPGTTALYRFYHLKTGAHFYTADVAERDRVRDTMSSIFSYEGPAYFVVATPGAGTQYVYRFFNRAAGVHFYTASDTERDNVANTLSWLYTYEGPAFNVPR